MQGKGVRSLESASERDRVVYWYSTQWPLHIVMQGKGVRVSSVSTDRACLYFYNIISKYLKFLASLMKDGEHPTFEKANAPITLWPKERATRVCQPTFAPTSTTRESDGRS